MPGKLLPGSQQQTMGVYRLTIPEIVPESLNPKARNGSTSFKAPRPKYLGDVYKDLPLDGPLYPSEPSFSDDDYCSSYVSSVFTASSTRTTSSTTSSTDDDSVLLEFASRTGSLDHHGPKRHSTACCTDLAYRRELRKRYEQTSAAVDTNTFSFRRELAVEDVDQNLALWEETSAEYTLSRPVRNNVHPAPHSWHAGDTAASSGSSRNKSSKASSKKKSFLNGLLSGLNFSTGRKLRKSAS